MIRIDPQLVALAEALLVLGVGLAVATVALVLGIAATR